MAGKRDATYRDELVRRSPDVANRAQAQVIVFQRMVALFRLNGPTSYLGRVAQRMIDAAGNCIDRQIVQGGLTLNEVHARPMRHTRSC
jgi:hypothetical protein